MKRLCFSTLLIFSLFVCDNVIQAQNKSEIIIVKGTVTDTEGNRIRKEGNVMIFPDVETSAEITNGVYKIYTNNDGELYFYIAGYFPERIKVENRTSIDVILEKDDRNFVPTLFKVTDEEGSPLAKVIFKPKLHPKELITITFMTHPDGTCVAIGPDQCSYTFYLDGYETQTVEVNKISEVEVIMKKLKE